MDGFFEVLKGVCWLAAFFLLSMFLYLVFETSALKDCETYGATRLNGKVIECSVRLERKGGE